MLLTRGMTGNQVRQIQALLKMAGYDYGIDGRFGRRTWKAVKQLQRRLGLPITGEWDDNLQAAATTMLQLVNPNPNTGTPAVPVWNGDPNRLPTLPNNADPSQRDAFARLRDVLTRYDLGDLTGWAWDQIIRGSSVDTVLFDLYDQPRFRERFAVIEERRQQGLPPLSVEQVLDYEQTTRQLMMVAGFPPNIFNDRSVIHDALVQDVSPAEMQQRIQRGYERVNNASPSVRQFFKDKFGIRGDTALALFFIDPDRSMPEIEKWATASVIGGEAADQGIALGADLIGNAVDRGLTDQEGRQAIGRVAQADPLLHELASERAHDITAEDAFQAVIGQNQQASRGLQRRLASRVAQDEGSADMGGGQGGFGGFGTGEDRRST